MRGGRTRALSLALALTALLSVQPALGSETAPAQEPAQDSTAFADVPAGHWAAPSIAAMARLGVMQGVGEGLFAPDQTITGAEFLVMLVRRLCPERVDLSMEGAWYLPYLYADADLLNRTSYSGVFDQPAVLERVLSRYDMAGMVAQAMDGVTYADPSAIADWAAVPDLYKDAVAAGWGMGLLRGVDDRGTFYGEGTMTRAQAAVVMERLIAVADAQGAPAPTPGGALTISRANAQVEAMDADDGFYIYSVPDGGENANNLGRFTFENPGYTHLRLTMRTGSTRFEGRHTFRVFDVSGAERKLLFYIYQRPDAQRTYDIDVTGVRRVNLAMCHTCYCEATLTEICLY